MVHRALDVVFQYLAPLVALLAALPLAVGGIAYALGHSQTVSARLWADRPAFTPNFASDSFASQASPAQTETSLVLEMVTTDTFAGQVLRKAEPGFDGWSQSQQDQALAELRKNLHVATAGDHVFVISYTTQQPGHGVALVKALIDVYSSVVQQMESSQATATETTLQSNLDAARQTMNKAVADAQAYQSRHGLSTQQAQADPNYSTLFAQAQAATDQYLQVQSQVEFATAARTAVVSLQSSLFHVVDPPALQPAGLTRTTPGLKEGGIALAGAAALEVLFVYVIARRDPTIRSAEDVRHALGLTSLGSVPVFRAR